MQLAGSRVERAWNMSACWLAVGWMCECCLLLFECCLMLRGGLRGCCVAVCWPFCGCFVAIWWLVGVRDR
eukprot:11191056-Lingulodinium_polyedra.AAC.1